MRIYFIRHCESEANTLRVFSNRDVKHDLTEKGRAQAEELAGKLKGIRFEAFYSSPVYRAVRTSEILKKRLDLPDFRIDEGLRESDVGILEGQSGEKYWIEHNSWEDWLLRGLFDRRHPEGENHYDVMKRFKGWFDPLRASYGGMDVNIIAVSHGALLMALPFVLKNITPEFSCGHLLSNTAIVIAEDRPDGFHCVKWNDIDINV